jgi:hypothetical protein
MHYKAKDNSLYFLSDEDIANGWASTLPAGSVQITDDEAQAIREQAKAGNRAQTIAARLAEIDALSVRALRATVAAQGKGRPVPAYDLDKLDALEVEAAALRLELASL